MAHIIVATLSVDISFPTSVASPPTLVASLPTFISFLKERIEGVDVLCLQNVADVDLFLKEISGILTGWKYVYQTSENTSTITLYNSVLWRVINPSENSKVFGLGFCKAAAPKDVEDFYVINVVAPKESRLRLEYLKEIVSLGRGRAPFIALGNFQITSDNFYETSDLFLSTQAWLKEFLSENKTSPRGVFCGPEGVVSRTLANIKTSKTPSVFGEFVTADIYAFRFWSS